MIFDWRDLDINLLIENQKAGKHLCLNGRYVGCYTDTCRKDLQRRIDDAVHFRNAENCRTDARSYYNGVLRVLRRKKRAVEREITKRQLTEESGGVPRLSKVRRRVTLDQRVLKLSGLL